MLRILLILLTLLIVAPTATYAQDDTARAVELVTQGNDMYDTGDFYGALVKYREAYSITEDARLLYRIGITYENVANYQRAREHLELFLLKESDSKYAGRVKSKIENLRNLEKSLQSAVKIESTPAGASVWLDFEQGKPAGITPVRIPVGPGTHTILIRKEGFEDVRGTIEIGAGETLEQTYDLGSGTAVAEKQADTPDEPDTTEEPPAVVADPAIYAGQPSRVRIGPSGGIAALSWISIAVGVSLVVGSGILAANLVYADDGVIGSGFLVGAGLVALGSYFLWFRNYTKALPPADTALLGLPPERFVGIGIRF